PVEELGQRVIRRAARVPARRGPALEVEVAALGIPGIAHPPDLLTGEDGGPDGRPARPLEVHVDRIGPGDQAVEDDVVAGARSLKGVHLDLARLVDELLLAAGRRDVLALVGVAGARRSEAGVRATEVVRP